MKCTPHSFGLVSFGLNESWSENVASVEYLRARAITAFAVSILLKNSHQNPLAASSAPGTLVPNLL